MTLPKVLVTDPVGDDPSLLGTYLADAGLEMLVPAQSGAWREGGWRELAPAADALIVNLVSLDAATLEALPRCRAIARLGVGTDNIDLAAARARGIIVSNVPDYCVEEVSDHALAMILASVRKLAPATRDIERGIWEQLRYRPIRRLREQTLGLLGLGRLARALAAKAQALGMRVIAHDPHARAVAVEMVSLEELLATCDILSLHAPALPETRHIIGRAALAAVKPGLVLVNTSRGELVDEAALAEALDLGRVSAAALDVFDGEPLDLSSRLRGRANVILTPHMAFYSEQSLAELQAKAVEDIVLALRGEQPIRRVA